MKEKLIICPGCPIPHPKHQRDNRFECVIPYGKCPNDEKRKDMVRKLYGKDYNFNPKVKVKK